MKLSDARAELQFVRRQIGSGEVNLTSGLQEAKICEAIDVLCGTEDKPTFVIVADDKFAGHAIRCWINSVANYVNENSPKLEQARAVLRAVLKWQRDNGADIPR